jgi:hypothetical protein
LLDNNDHDNQYDDATALAKCSKGVIRTQPKRIHITVVDTTDNDSAADCQRYEQRSTKIRSKKLIRLNLDLHKWGLANQKNSFWFQLTTESQNFHVHSSNVSIEFAYFGDREHTLLQIFVNGSHMTTQVSSRCRQIVALLAPTRESNERAFEDRSEKRTTNHIPGIDARVAYEQTRDAISVHYDQRTSCHICFHDGKRRQKIRHFDKKAMSSHPQQDEQQQQFLLERLLLSTPTQSTTPPSSASLSSLASTTPALANSRNKISVTTLGSGSGGGGTLDSLYASAAVVAPKITSTPPAAPASSVPDADMTAFLRRLMAPNVSVPPQQTPFGGIGASAVASSAPLLPTHPSTALQQQQDSPSSSAQKSPDRDSSAGAEPRQQPQQKARRQKNNNNNNNNNNQNADTGSSSSVGVVAGGVQQNRSDDGATRDNNDIKSHDVVGKQQQQQQQQQHEYTQHHRHQQQSNDKQPRNNNNNNNNNSNNKQSRRAQQQLTHPDDTDEQQNASGGAGHENKKQPQQQQSDGQKASKGNWRRTASAPTTNVITVNLPSSSLLASSPADASGSFDIDALTERDLAEPAFDAPARTVVDSSAPDANSSSGDGGGSKTVPTLPRYSRAQLVRLRRSPLVAQCSIGTLPEPVTLAAAAAAAAAAATASSTTNAATNAKRSQSNRPARSADVEAADGDATNANKPQRAAARAVRRNNKAAGAAADAKVGSDDESAKKPSAERDSTRDATADAAAVDNNDTDNNNNDDDDDDDPQKALRSVNRKGPERW